MNVSRMVVPIRVSADDGRVTGKVFFAEFQAKSLCLFHGQAVVGCISGVKADDILMALNITMLGVLAILAVCQQTGRCKREIAALKGVEQVGFPQFRSAVFIQKLLPGERIVLVNKIRFNRRVVRVFITIRLFKSLATTSNCMSQICGLWLNNVATLATELICLSVAIQFTQNFLSVEPECGQVCKFVKDFRPDQLGVCTAGIEVPCKLVQISAHPAALGEQGGNDVQGFFSAAGNDNSALDLRTVQRTADEGGQGEMKEFCCALEFHLFSFRHSELDGVRFVVRRVVVPGIARGRLNIRFGHCTSCLFDNSSVKLCKHDTPLLFAPSGANHEQGLGQARPNKITSEMQMH